MQYNAVQRSTMVKGHQQWSLFIFHFNVHHEFSAHWALIDILSDLLWRPGLRTTAVLSRYSSIGTVSDELNIIWLLIWSLIHRGNKPEPLFIRGCSKKKKSISGPAVSRPSIKNQYWSQMINYECFVYTGWSLSLCCATFDDRDSVPVCHHDGVKTLHTDGRRHSGEIRNKKWDKILLQ